MAGACIDYSILVAIARALLDAWDRLKPVHRRILCGKQELGLSLSKPFKIAAIIVGEVLGNCCLHGNSSLYDATVRITQERSLHCPVLEDRLNFTQLFTGMSQLLCIILQPAWAARLRRH